MAEWRWAPSRAVRIRSISDWQTGTVMKDFSTDTSR